VRAGVSFIEGEGGALRAAFLSLKVKWIISRLLKSLSDY
jgi:hypothetical protein